MSILAAQTDSVRPNSPPPEARWGDVLRQAIRSPSELCTLLRLPEEFARAAERAAADFPLFVTRPYVARMRPGDPADPLLRQVLPIADEELAVPGFSTDPVGDAAAERAPGMLHKYTGRALLVVTGACAVHCRYCFRRHYPYSAPPSRSRPGEPVLAEIAADDSLAEVLLSGGDPLVLPDNLLAALAERLAAIPHVRRMRIHTRLPIFIPERVTADLLAWLTGTRLRPVMVIHANHPAELDDAVARSLARLAEAGVLLLNQSVLLRGVNDSADVLAALSERLIDLGVLPYYLHQLDPVAGAAHFLVSEEEGLRLVGELRRRLPGYAVPRYVCELPGEPSKTPIA